MKKIIIFLTILISTIFSNVAFADIIVSEEEKCLNYNTEEYKNCNLSCVKKYSWRKGLNEKLWKCQKSCCKQTSLSEIFLQILIFCSIIIFIFLIKWFISFLLSKITFLKNINNNFIKIYFSSSFILFISIFITLIKTFWEFQRFDNSWPLLYWLWISIFLTFLAESFLYYKITKIKYKKSLIFAFFSNFSLIMLVILIYYIYVNIMLSEL